jgi:hypothetical protein
MLILVFAAAALGLSALRSADRVGDDAASLAEFAHPFDTGLRRCLGKGGWRLAAPLGNGRYRCLDRCSGPAG